ncbi:hypothetical protein MUK42_23421 [Musa troglodytarum]|uniref:Uncharacterized protein n=1 Tax=Musa troglodytarum TaxID=320322 RepID=A0A9E7GCQ6_9LILI|nr:hypothetical protein MUK42_23421 [Musa troglodytarum]URE09898.1 hypothetical protein MUK42_23421 [Musa troglodytarum]URE09899.1 hypothetical protein MUK42_23421 [Musa troglodytarum]
MAVTNGGQSIKSKYPHTHRQHKPVSKVLPPADLKLFPLTSAKSGCCCITPHLLAFPSSSSSRTTTTSCLCAVTSLAFRPWPARCSIWRSTSPSTERITATRPTSSSTPSSSGQSSTPPSSSSTSPRRSSTCPPGSAVASWPSTSASPLRWPSGCFMRSWIGEPDPWPRSSASSAGPAAVASRVALASLLLGR